MSLLMGLLYFNIDFDQSGVQSIMGATTLVMMNTFMTSGFGLTQELPLALPTAFRENKLGLYSLSAWFWAKTIGDTVLDSILPFVGVTLFYWFVRLRDDAGTWLSFSAVICLVSLMGSSWGYLCSMAGGRVEIAFALFLLTIFPFLIFSGFFIPASSVPIFLRWLADVGPFKYVFSQLVILVWDGRGAIDGCVKTGAKQFCPFPDGNSVMRFFSIEASESALNLTVICAYVVVARLLAWLCLLWRGRQR